MGPKEWQRNHMTSARNLAKQPMTEADTHGHELACTPASSVAKAMCAQRAAKLQQ
jgi:hypothetical protein